MRAMWLQSIHDPLRTSQEFCDVRHAPLERQHGLRLVLPFRLRRSRHRASRLGVLRNRVPVGPVLSLGVRTIRTAIVAFSSQGPLSLGREHLACKPDFLCEELQQQKGQRRVCVHEVDKVFSREQAKLRHCDPDCIQPVCSTTAFQRCPRSGTDPPNASSRRRLRLSQRQPERLRGERTLVTHYISSIGHDPQERTSRRHAPSQPLQVRSPRVTAQRSQSKWDKSSRMSRLRFAYVDR